MIFIIADVLNSSHSDSISFCEVVSSGPDVVLWNIKAIKFDCNQNSKLSTLIHAIFYMTQIRDVWTETIFIYYKLK